MVVDELGIADLVLEYRLRNRKSTRSLVACKSRKRSLMAPGYAWSIVVLFECPKCGAGAERKAQLVRECQIMSKEYRPVCHNNRYHGCMEQVGTREDMVMCSWA